jgi:hypothetical protein
MCIGTREITSKDHLIWLYTLLHIPFFIGVSVDQCYVVIAVSKSYSGTISKL